MKKEIINNKLDDLIYRDVEGKAFEEKEKEKEKRKLFAFEIAKEITGQLKPILKEKENYNEIVKAIDKIKFNPVVNVDPPIVKVAAQEIKIPEIKIPKADKPVINLKPNIEVKASDVKIPKVMEVKGFFDFAKLAVNILRGKFKLDASKENPLPVQLVYDNKFYEALGGGGGPRRIWLKNKSNQSINPATENKQDDTITEIAKGLVGDTQSDGLGTKYHITTDSSGRIHTRSFKNAAGDGRRMLVDNDRHGQVDVLSSIDKPFTTLIDDFTTANKTYIGKAVAGASEGGVVWQIKCLDETGNFLKIGFADGVSTFTKEWDNRATYTFT